MMEKRNDNNEKKSFATSLASIFNEPKYDLIKDEKTMVPR